MVSSANYGGWKLRGARSGSCGTIQRTLHFRDGPPTTCDRYRIMALLLLPAATGYTLSSMRPPVSTRVASPAMMAESAPCAFLQPHSPMPLRTVCVCALASHRCAHTRLCRCAVANGKMQFKNVAREWRCKWTDDGGGSAACDTPRCLGKSGAPQVVAPSHRQRQAGPRGQLLRASASLLEVVHVRPHGTHVLHVHMHSRSMRMACACGIKQTHGHAHAHLTCTSAGKASSAALVEIADLVEEYLPKRPITLTLYPSPSPQP